jgi:B-block binding subunit of TFIIIC
VWRWLTKHPDVYIGRGGRGNKLSLSAVEAQYATEAVRATSGAESDSPDTVSYLTPRLDQHGVVSNSRPLESAKSSVGPRVFVSEERMWLAICGHPKDSTQVSDLEFILLSIIAAHQEAGILQGDLVKESGQDKRSVPKRTDVLRDKGYIEKRLVHLKGLKTSRLVLRKFASGFGKELIVPVSASVGVQESLQGELIDFDILLANLFAILKGKQMITRDDLRKEVQMTTKWRSRVLSRVIRKLEIIGCLKRVKAASEVSKTVRYYFDCIKLVHEPSQKDLEAFHASRTNSIEDNAIEEQDVDDEDDGAQAVTETAAGLQGNQLEEVGRVVPQWNPDRPLANVLLELVDSAGIQGFTNRVSDVQF